MEILQLWRKERVENDNNVRISRFGESTNTEWDNVVKKTIIEKPNFTNIILDLKTKTWWLLKFGSSYFF